MIRNCPALASIIAAMCVLGACVTGCRQESPALPGGIAQKPTPAESFQEIASVVKDGLEMRATGMPSGFVKEKGGARSTFQVTNIVTSELIPPSKPEDTYRGTITVTRRTLYSLRRSAENSDERSDRESADDTSGGYSLLDDPLAGGSGVEVIDDTLIAAGSNNKKSLAGSGDTVNSRPDEDIRTYELAYEDDRWVLKTELNPEWEQSVINAFNRALSRQP